MTKRFGILNTCRRVIAVYWNEFLNARKAAPYPILGSTIIVKSSSLIMHVVYHLGEWINKVESLKLAVRCALGLLAIVCGWESFASAENVCHSELSAEPIKSNSLFMNKSAMFVCAWSKVIRERLLYSFRINVRRLGVFREHREPFT